MLEKKNIWHGVAYYPELWPKDQIDKDIKNFKELGINVVRIGEFAWSFFEPEMNNFNIGIYDDVINKLGENGIMTMLCTPTATPPRWFTYKYPNSLYIDRRMTKAHHGSREHVCMNNDDYLRRTEIIVEKLAKHYGNNPNVIAWQTHNEYNCPPVDECVCDSCQAKWRLWLKDKYQTIDNLNNKWGSYVWSTKYNDFNEMLPPRPTPNGHSASLTTNYTKFIFDTVAKYNNFQVSIMKKYIKVPITHNTNRVFHLNQETLFENLDFVSFDDYSTQESFTEKMLNAEMSRGLKPDTPFWELETASSNSANLYGTKVPHKKGYLKAEAVADFFAGAIGFSYWLYRQQKSGTEMPHGHLVTSWGSKSYSAQSVKEVSKAIEELEPFILNTHPKKAQIGLMYSDEARAFAFSETMNSINYRDDILDFYEKILKAGVYRDIVYPSSDLSNYNLIFVPYVQHISKPLEEKLLKAVKNGTTLVMGPYSGWRTEDHVYHTDYCFGDLEKNFDEKIIDVVQFYGTGQTFEFLNITSKLDNIAAITKSGIGTIKGDFLEGNSVLTENKIGKGKLVFLGTKLDSLGMETLINHYIDETISKDIKLDAGIIKYLRSDNKGNDYICLINMTSEDKAYTLKDKCENYLTKEIHKGRNTLKSLEYQILKK